MTTEQKSARKRVRRRIALIVGAAAVGGLALAAQLQRVDEVNFMGDESGWIASAGYYTDLVIRGDFSQVSWEGAHLGPWGSINPSLGKILLGAGLRLHPSVERRDLEFRQIYRFSQSFEWNAKWGNVPYESTVIRAREVTAVFYSAALALFFLAIALHSNAFAGALAVLAVLTNSWVINETTPVLTDPYFFLFAFGLVCLGGRVIDAATLRSKVVWYGAAGLLAGAACSVKINGLPLAGIFVASLMGYSWSVRRPIVWKEDGAAIGAFSVCALALVYALNPYFWPTNSWRNVLEFPRLYGRWPELFAVQREQSPWPDSGRTAEMIRVLFGLFTLFAVELLFFGIGFVVLAYHAVRSTMERRADGRVVLLAFFVANIAFMFALMPVNYRRYYLLAVFSIKVIEAVGLAWLVVSALTWLRRRAFPRGQTAGFSEPRARA